MTSPLPPRRRDTKTLADLLRQDRTNLRQLDPGLVGGRYSPAKPVEPFLEDDEEGDDDDGNLDLIHFLNTDRIVLAADGGSTSIPLTYVPEDGSEQVFWHGTALARHEWSRTDAAVTIPAQSYYKAGEEFWIDYAYYGEPTDLAMSLVLRGASLPVSAPTTIALPDGTQIGDLIVVANATMHYNGTPGGGTPSDSRLTQVGHGAWVGVATTLDPVAFIDPLAWDADRHTAAVATFARPVAYLNDADAGPGAGASGTLTAPVVAARGAILVVTEDNPNSPDSPANTVPDGYVMAVDPDGGGPSATVCDVGIWYWVDPDASASPAGSIGYICHASGFAYATTIGLQATE